MSVAKYVRTQWKIGMFEPPNSSDGTVYLHREIASEKLGRKLKPGETVHHVDEDKFNNDPENLWVFRSNADHSSYHNQKLLNLIPEIIINEDGSYTTIKYRQEILCECGNDKSYDADKCKSCNEEWIARNIPSKEELQKLIWEIPSTQIAEIYNVSDKSISKWCKKYNLSKPPRGYWTKLKSKSY